MDADTDAVVITDLVGTAVVDGYTLTVGWGLATGAQIAGAVLN